MVTGTFLLKTKWQIKQLTTNKRENIFKKSGIFQISIYFKIFPAFVQPAKIRQL